jgi:hypothetical protein
MRWLLLLLAVFGFALAFSTKSASVLGLGIVVGLIGLVGSFFMMAAARVESRSRPDAALLTDADINALRESVRKNRASQTPQPGSAPKTASTQ